MAYTTANLLSAIARRSFMPANQSTFSDLEILAMATEEFRSWILPEIFKIRQEFMVYHKDYAITANQAGYVVPDRAFGSTVREVQIIRGSQIIDPSLIAMEHVDSTQTGYPQRFYFKNDKVMLFPTPSATADTLRMHYYLTPGELIETTEAAIISAIDTGTGVVSVTTIPDGWVTGDTFDFIKKTGGHEYRDVDAESTLVSGTDITFSSLPSDLVVGDYICLQGYSPLVQIPFTLRETLAQHAAAALLEYADQPGAGEARGKAQAMLAKAVDPLSPRVIGEQQFITHDWF